MDFPRFVYSLIDGHLGCFFSLASVNRAAVSIHVQVFVWVYVFISLGHMPGNVIAGSYGNCV